MRSFHVVAIVRGYGGAALPHLFVFIQQLNDF